MKTTIILLVLLLIGWGIYHLFLKDGVVEVSGEAISKLIGMDVRFDSYEFLDDASLEITGLVIKSPYPKEDYREVNDFHTDWIIAKIGRIRLDDFDYKRLIQYREWSASKITVDSATVDIYRDKTLPEPPFVYKPLPATALRKLRGSVNVDTLFLTGSSIRYVERTENAPEPGEIVFANLNARCFHLTNDSARLAENPFFEIHATTRVFEKADLEADMQFDMGSAREAFKLEADVGAFDAEVLNAMVSGVLPARITEGDIRGMRILMRADEDRMTGELEFDYGDMKFDLLPYENEEWKSGMATTAGKLIIRKDNLPERNNHRVGELSFDRRKDRSIFNYWWNGLKSGIVDVMMSDAGKAINLDEKAMEVKGRTPSE